MSKQHKQHDEDEPKSSKIEVENTGRKEQYEYKITTLPPATPDTQITEALNKSGSEGWEVIGMDFNNFQTHGAKVILRRKKN